MSIFTKLNDYVINVMLTLLESQNLCKYLYYNTEDPLSGDDVEPKKILYQKIFPSPKIPETQTIQSSLLTIVFDSFKPGNDNKGVVQGKLLLTIFVHNELWFLREQNKLRPFCIMDEINKLFNNKRIIGIKELHLENCRLVQPNNDYSGYQLIYKVVGANIGENK